MFSSKTKINRKKLEPVYSLLNSCESGHLDILKNVLNNSDFVDVNCSDFSGLTPLMVASRENNLEIVKFLLKNGANTHLKNNRGEQAIDLTSNPRICDLLNSTIQALPSFTATNSGIAELTINLTEYKMSLFNTFLYEGGQEHGGQFTQSNGNQIRIDLTSPMVYLFRPLLWVTVAISQITFQMILFSLLDTEPVTVFTLFIFFFTFALSIYSLHALRKPDHFYLADNRQCKFIYFKEVLGSQSADLLAHFNEIREIRVDCLGHYPTQYQVILYHRDGNTEIPFSAPSTDRNQVDQIAYKLSVKTGITLAEYR